MKIGSSLHTFTIEKDLHGRRLDQVVHHFMPDHSRNACATLIKNGHVSINQKKIDKPGHTVQEGQVITITVVEKKPFVMTHKEALDLAIPIVLQTDDFIIINKPAGIITHTTHPTRAQQSVSGWAQTLFPEIAHVGNPERPGIVHRLDTDTTGLLIIARTPAAYTKLTELFKTRTIKKQYLAIVHGHPEPDGSIDMPLARNPVHRTKMEVAQNGRKALTHYHVQEYFKDSALLLIDLETGRTHQIRVHCAAIKHPVVGDRLYGKASPRIKRQALHAYRLSFSYNGTNYSVEAPPPADMQQLIQQQ